MIVNKLKTSKLNNLLDHKTAKYCLIKTPKSEINNFLNHRTLKYCHIKTCLI